MKATASSGGYSRHPPATSGAGRSGAVHTLLVAGLISSVFTITTVRLASPLILDEFLTALALFVVAPTVLIILLGLVRPFVGGTVAAALPFAWLAIVVGPGDPATLWLLPVACAVALGAMFRTRLRREAARAVAAACACALAIALLLPQPGAPRDGTRMVLIGIDGASWQCVDAAIAAGRMPNMKRLLEEGHRARLRSLPSMLSPQVWSAIATGCPPEVNGIYGWAHSQTDFRVGRVWDRMWMDGRTAGTCGWYFTWPPPDALSAADFVVPSTLAPDSSTLPPNCGFFWEFWARHSGRATSGAKPVTALMNALRSGVRLSTLRRGLFVLAGGSGDDLLDIDGVWKRRQISAAIQSDMFCELLRNRRPELGAVLFNQVDKVSHLYWKYREPNLFPDVTPEEAQRLSSTIELLYGEADRCVGKVLGAVPQGANVVIVSDHGFQPALRKIMGRFCRIRTEALIQALDAEEIVLGTNLDQKAYLEIISGTEEEREETLSRLASVLRDAHIDGEDFGVFSVTREGDVLELQIAPRNEVPEVARIILGGRECGFDSLIAARLEARFSGEHAPDGVYLLAGPMAAFAAKTDSLNVLDVAPTVAAILGLPMSTLWSGRPAFDEAAPVRLEYGEYPPPTALPSMRRGAPDEMLKEELRSLGYIE